MPLIQCEYMESIDWITEKQGVQDYGNLKRTDSDVWRVPVAMGDGFVPNNYHLLSAGEQARADRYHLERDRNRFLVSRIALRQILSLYHKNLTPPGIEFANEPNKKPFIKNGNYPGLHFNTAHAGEHILIAVSAKQVGIDVEKIDQGFAYEEILQKNFSTEEIVSIRNARRQFWQFYLLWTRKEALLKATSTGLHDELNKLNVIDGVHDLPKKLVGSDTSWDIASFTVDDMHIGSIAMPGGEKALRFFDFHAVPLP